MKTINSSIIGAGQATRAAASSGKRQAARASCARNGGVAGGRVPAAAATFAHKQRSRRWLYCSRLAGALASPRVLAPALAACASGW